MFDIIVAATDGSEEAHRAIRLAGEVAASQAAKLVLTHVIDPETEDEHLRRFADSEDFGVVPAGKPHLDPMAAARAGVPPVPEDVNASELDLVAAQETIGQRILLQAHGIASEAGASIVETELRRGDPVEEIVEAAMQHSADAIFLGTRGQGHLAQALLGSVSHKVGQNSDVTCVTVS